MKRLLGILSLGCIFVLGPVLGLAADEDGPSSGLFAPSSGPSGLRWVGGNEGSPLMNPGLDCISCHSQGEGPRFEAAGTVYLKLNEKNLDLGVEGATVEITDAKGKVFKAVTNKAGNFSFRRVALSFPIKAKVLYQGKTREMYGARMTGNCASCHSQTGQNGAPGRVTVP